MTDRSITNQETKSAGKILFVLALLILSYTLIRAYLLSFTWDEAFSYLQYTRNGILIPAKYEMMDANNHLLNTWLDIHLIKIFGVSEFVLRLPSLFSHVLFLFFSYKLVIGFHNRWLIIASFLIINLNPYLLDFFSLSRGYGLSVGLMMGSIYFLYAWMVNGHKTKHAIGWAMMGSLAVAANFVMLNYFVVSFGLLVCMSFYNAAVSDKTIATKAIQFLRAIAFPLLIVCISLGVLLPIVLKLKDAGALFYGSNKGFWTDTFCTITDRYFYERGYNYWFQRILKGFVMLITAAAGVFAGIRFLKKGQTANSSFTGIMAMLLFLCALATVVQHYVFGTLYLIDRTALFLVVIFSVVLVFFANEISNEIPKAAVLVYSTVLFVVFHFTISFNLHNVLEWKWDADIKEMIVDLEKIKTIPKEKETVSMSIPLEFDQGINFYRAHHHLSWLNTVERSKPITMLNDYLFLGPEEYGKMNMDSLVILKKYPETGNILAKPKYMQPMVISHSDVLTFEGLPGKQYVIDEKVEYAQGFNYIINDSIAPIKNSTVAFKADVMTEDIKKCNVYFIISFENKDGLYAWKRAYVEDELTTNGVWASVHFTSLVPEEAKSGDVLKAYLWNPNKHKVYMKRMEFKWINNKNKQ